MFFTPPQSRSGFFKSFGIAIDRDQPPFGTDFGKERLRVTPQSHRRVDHRGTRPQRQRAQYFINQDRLMDKEPLSEHAVVRVSPDQLSVIP